ncbi:MAG: hypothetical protein PVSMB5_17950 [Ktedonobacteraceae bacterium]
MLRQYQALAKKYDADPILMVATEAIRKAANKDEFLAAIKRETDLTVNVVSGDMEAILTFYGATYELAREDHTAQRSAVMDLGGGSTELVLAKQMQIHWHTSLPIGSGWLHDRLNIKHLPPTLIATGGSANSLLLLAQRAFRLDSSQAQLTEDDLLRCEGLLCALPAEEIAQRYGLEAKRARILTAGSLIIRAVMERLQLRGVRISSRGLREGILLAYSRHGEQWLERIQKRGLLADQVDTEKQDAAPYDEEFIQSGRRLLHERTQKMLEWRKDVLKHEDIEAVHKMRVASRRLRAVLDAYEPICEPKHFKKVYRRVKNVADILGMARDTDVMIERVHERLDHSTDSEKYGMRWLVKHLEGYRAQHQKKLEVGLEDVDDDALQRQIAACLPEGGVQGGKS